MIRSQAGVSGDEAPNSWQPGHVIAPAPLVVGLGGASTSGSGIRDGAW
jgi:hypothetical protein